MEDRFNNSILSVAEKLSEYSQNDTNYVGMKASIREAVDYMLVAMFPQYNGQDLQVCKACAEAEDCKTSPVSKRVKEALNRASLRLISALSCVVPYHEACDLSEKLILSLPSVFEMIEKDVQAAYEGDPAAVSKDEIILTYPAFPAISIFRIAHSLFELGAPVAPRMMTEYAHELTGIDIHPGAKIGPYFFIDHGTGVVIGETTTIGEHVKLYQHVTLGAKSFEMNPDGSLVKGIKRHPDIGNNVIIYAGATILGGDTHIGDNCVIGGNVWLTHSIRPNQTVVR